MGVEGRTISAQQQWALNHPVAKARIDRRARIKRRFDITDIEYDLRMDAALVCDCCKKPFVSKKNLDHCHATNTLRGVLCNRCNVGIGLLGDDEAGVLQALEYLRGLS